MKKRAKASKVYDGQVIWRSTARSLDTEKVGRGFRKKVSSVQYLSNLRNRGLKDVPIYIIPNTMFTQILHRKEKKRQKKLLGFLSSTLMATNTT